MFLGLGRSLVFVQSFRSRALVDHRRGFGLPIGLITAFFRLVRGRFRLGLRSTPAACQHPRKATAVTS